MRGRIVTVESLLEDGVPILFLEPMTETDVAISQEASYRCKIIGLSQRRLFVSMILSSPFSPFFFPLILPFYAFPSTSLSSSIVQFTRYQVGGKIYRAPVSGIWVNGFTFYSRSRPSIRPCDFLRPVMVNIYIYLVHSLTYLDRGRLMKIAKSQEEDFEKGRWFSLLYRFGDVTVSHHRRAHFLHGLHNTGADKIAACINWPCSPRDAYTGRPSAVATRDLTQIGEVPIPARPVRALRNRRALASFRSPG